LQVQGNGKGVASQSSLDQCAGSVGPTGFLEGGGLPGIFYDFFTGRPIFCHVLPARDSIRVFFKFSGSLPGFFLIAGSGPEVF
jgi:hypothetical protein